MALWASTYLSLETYLPTSESCWREEFVKIRIRNLQSLLVCPIILWKSSLTGDLWISGWRSWLASLIQSWCLAFPHHMWWCVFWYIRDPWIGLLRIKCWRRRRWICKTFPGTPCVSQILGGLSLRLGIPRERLSIPPGSWKSWKIAGWLETWDCPLRTDSASLNLSNHKIQLTPFCSFWILAVSSRIVSRSSSNLLLENPSNVDRWNRFNSSISLRLFIWASRSSRFCSNNCSWRSCWSRRSCSSPSRAPIISPRWDSITPSIFAYFFCRNRPETRVSEPLLYNQRESALFVFQRESWFAHFQSRGLGFLWRLNLAN